MKTRYLLAAVLLLSVSCSSETDPVSVDGSIPQTGLVDTTITHDGMEREHLVYVPQAYDMNEAALLVFSFHAAGGSEESQYELSQFDVIADKENFILVTPEAGKANDRLTWWNFNNNSHSSQQAPALVDGLT
jgi:polyhydroxybutyrate depolymerase